MSADNAPRDEKGNPACVSTQGSATDPRKEERLVTETEAERTEQKKLAERERRHDEKRENKEKKKRSSKKQSENDQKKEKEKERKDKKREGKTDGGRQKAAGKGTEGEAGRGARTIRSEEQEEAAGLTSAEGVKEGTGRAEKIGEGDEVEGVYVREGVEKRGEAKKSADTGGEADEQPADEAPGAAADLGEPGKKDPGAAADERATDQVAHEVAKTNRRSEGFRLTSGDEGATSERPGEDGVSEESGASSEAERDKGRPAEDNEGRDERESEPVAKTVRGAEAGKGDEEVEEKRNDIREREHEETWPKKEDFCRRQPEDVEHYDGLKQEGVTSERTGEGSAGDGLSVEREKGRPGEDEKGAEETERAAGESVPAGGDQYETLGCRARKGNEADGAEGDGVDDKEKYNREMESRTRRRPDENDEKENDHHGRQQGVTDERANEGPSVDEVSDEKGKGRPDEGKEGGEETEKGEETEGAAGEAAGVHQTLRRSKAPRGEDVNGDVEGDAVEEIQDDKRNGNREREQEKSRPKEESRTRSRQNDK